MTQIIARAIVRVRVDRELYLPLVDPYRIYDHTIAGKPTRAVEGLRGSTPVEYDEIAWEMMQNTTGDDQLREALATYDARELESLRLLNAIPVATGQRSSTQACYASRS